MADESTRLKRFLADQEEAVEIARNAPEGGNPLRIDAVNVALSLAHTNAVACDHPTTIAELIENAKAAEKYLSGAE